MSAKAPTIPFSWTSITTASPPRRCSARPEGLSVYVDGVRVNESFGDTVNWDLIPESAISTVTLMSGSNPVFGLNTLGGALSIQTKSGHDNPGTELEAYGGSFGRRSFQAESGGERGAFDYFVHGHYFDEDRLARPVADAGCGRRSARSGWQNDKTDIDLSYTYADTSLFGNGAVPQSMLNYRREASYTPDSTQNLLNFVNLTGTQFLAENLLLSANGYYRHLITGSSNGNNNDNYLSERTRGRRSTAALPPDQRVDIAYCSQATTQVSQLSQRTAGFGVQLTDSQTARAGRTRPSSAPTSAIRRTTSCRTSGTAPLRRIARYLPGQSAQRRNRDLPERQQPHLRRLPHRHAVAQLPAARHARRPLQPQQRDPRRLQRRHRRRRRRGGLRPGEPADRRPHLHAPQSGARLHRDANDAATYYANYNEASRAPTVLELGCANPAAAVRPAERFCQRPGSEAGGGAHPRSSGCVAIGPTRV